MKKSNRVRGVGAARKGSAVAASRERPASLPAVVAKGSALGPIWEPPALPVPRPSLPARVKSEFSRPIAEPPELPAVPPPRVSRATVETNAGVWMPPDPAMARLRPRVVFCIDRTASRHDSFEPAKRLTDAVLGALRPELTKRPEFTHKRGKDLSENPLRGGFRTVFQSDVVFRT